MKNKALFILLLLLCLCSIYLLAWNKIGSMPLQEAIVPATVLKETVLDDTVKNLFPVKKTQITQYSELGKSYPIDLRDPGNIQSQIEYDVQTGNYLYKTKIGDGDWVTAIVMTPAEYNDYMLNRSMSTFFKKKYDEERETGEQAEEFSLKDIKISLGPAEKIFGPGGVRISPSGHIELKMGLNHTKRDDPTATERNRSRMQFDFDEQINMQVKASVGDKVNFDMNYNTQTNFDMDSKKLKLAYEGKEDEILKRLEGGNVSMTTTNSLINGGVSLFGIKTDLQFGKLKISALISQQESESQSVSSKGGVQTTPFELTADQYDENRHFFLGFYFRDNYDDAMKTLPYISSPVNITSIEVWRTNKRGTYDQARNIVAFADLGETTHAHSPWNSQGDPYPNNRANDLYQRVIDDYSAIRDISKVTSTLENAGLESGRDYEKIENAQLLTASDYKYDAQTGYISLTQALQADEVLAVAYVFQVGDKSYKVGELSADIPSAYDGSKNAGSLIVKLLKPVSLSPEAYTWDLMMKNIYSLNAYSVQQDKFRLHITYYNDSAGTDVKYISEGDIKNKMLLQVMNLDNLDARQNRHPDGIFDFVEGKTVVATSGRIIFPVVEPFGEHLEKAINDPSVAEKYVYHELYDKTLTEARQVSEKNKFKIIGEYRASNNAEIMLNAMNVARGSVRVTAGGQTLTEGVDYSVDYMMGRVTILNQSIIDAGTPVSVSLENQSMFSMQRKTLMGLNLSYDFSKDFTLGGTIMHLTEQPLTMKTEPGDESLNNTIWGLNTAFQTQSTWLTNLVDKLPFYDATAPSSITFSGEFAHLIPGHYENKYSKGYSFLDDFESSSSSTSLLTQYDWVLASTPQNKAAGSSALFPEAMLSNDIAYNKNRAHLTWFNISEETFLQRNSSITPQHIKNDKEQLSNHFIRQIYVNELYPKRDIQYNEMATVSALNLVYYPNERGMYNIYYQDNNFDTNGYLTHPEKRWGGMMRRMDNKDFEAQNYEYIEFWLMDPFVYSRDTVADENQISGSLFFNLGDVSEDILKDGKKFYENGLPTTNDSTLFETTEWGRVPTRQSTVYSFDNADRDIIAMQDVGFNGLSTAQEFDHKNYKNFVEYMQSYLTGDARQRLLDDPFSLLNDPAGDNYHHYRGSDYDERQLSIFERYKHYNGVEGNTVNGNETYPTTARNTPDVEDIDQDKTMNETESYFQYEVKLSPSELETSKYIVDRRQVTVKLANGKNDKVTWYRFKIPFRERDNYERIGTINDFKSIRFIRMFLTGFKQTTCLRFGSFDLVRGDWRTYSNTLKADDSPAGSGSLIASTINIEENGDRRPVNYILPPGVTRITDPNQPQLTQENEQAMSLKVIDLEPFDARAIYKNTAYDLRRYKKLQMFVHAENIQDAVSPFNKGELTVFMRLGSDYKNNYYEYEIPVTITPEAPTGGYSNSSSTDRLTVWPAENMFDFPLELLKNIKLNRNAEKRKPGSAVNFTTLYSEYDPDNPNNKVSVKGNPSLSEIKILMVGVRNNSREIKSGEVWINELRLTDFDEEGGWAAQGSLNINLSDLATISLTGHKETAGFGSIDQGLTQRRIDDLTTYSLSANIDLGKLLPPALKVTLPLYYSYTNQATSPKYDPLDQDVSLDESVAALSTKHEKDSVLNLAQDKTVSKNLSLTNMKVNVKSKKSMPYDPANLNMSYSFSENYLSNPTTTHDITRDYKGNISYNYTPTYTPWAPFKKVSDQAFYGKFAKAISINYLPQNIAFNTSIQRNFMETLTRDLESYTLGENNAGNEFVSRSQEFYWDRDFDITWDLTKNLRFSFHSGTQAEIEEPLFVNRDISETENEEWRRKVKESLLSGGAPYAYNQNTKADYTMPFPVIPILDWITSTESYQSTYNWNRGADNYEDIEIGNTLENSLTLSSNNSFDLTKLYNKWEFLKKTNQKFDTATPRNERGAARNRQRQGAGTTAEKNRYETAINLIPDSALVIKHNLNSKNLQVSAKDTVTGKIYQIKYKKTDENTITIVKVKDSASVKLSVLKGPDPSENFWYKAAQYTARALMSVRSIKIQYTHQRDNHIYGYRPQVGDIFGQKGSDMGYQPGFDFAFGFNGGEDYVRQLYRNSMLVGTGTGNISPSVANQSTRWELRSDVEPIKGFKIELTASHESTDRTELYYMYEGMPRNLGGSFAMTTIAIQSIFESPDAGSNYFSRTFEKFLQNRQTLLTRIENQYAGATYPASGFIEGTIAGQPYSPHTFGGTGINSSDVLIPAFIAAYTGKDAGGISLSPFPAASSMLPNWKVTYNGFLDLLPALKKTFKSFNFTHAYNCRYSVGSYTSFAGWVQWNNNLGFIENTVTGNPIPSSPYNISSVSIQEALNPLLGAEGTLTNTMTIRLSYATERTLNLNVSAYQLVEQAKKDFTLGLGYTIANFNRVLGIKDKKNSTFSNDLKISGDVTYSRSYNLLRKIEEGYTQATQGVTNFKLSFSAEYAMSKALTLKAFLEHITNTPLVSANSYPTATTDFGISIRFQLMQ